MNELFNEMMTEVATTSVSLSNIWVIEFVKQNYNYIIMFFIALLALWFIGLIIKNWIWKIDRISSSLERIAFSLDHLVAKSNQKSTDVEFTEKSVENNKNN